MAGEKILPNQEQTGKRPTATSQAIAPPKGLEPVARRAFNPDPNLPHQINRIGFTIATGTFQEFEVSEGRVLVFAEALLFGTSAGEFTLRFGETGDDFPIAPGDNIVTSGFRRFRLTNVGPSNRSGAVLVSSDPNFRVLNTPRGL